MAFRKATLSAGIKTKAGVTHLLTRRAVFAAPAQDIDDFDETMIGGDFPHLQSIVIRGSAEVQGLLWEAGNPILEEFVNDREVELAVWHTTGGVWHWGRYVVPDASPQDFNGLYAFNGTWPINSEGVAGTSLSTATSGIDAMDVPEAAYGFIYTSVATDASLTATSAGTAYSIEIAGGKGFVCGQLKSAADAIVPSKLTNAAITVSAGTDVVWGIGRELTI